jgi:HEPN domain-containing protein
MSAQGNAKRNNANAKERELAQLKAVITDVLKNAFPQNKEVSDNIEAIFDLTAKKVHTPDDETCKLGFDFLNEATKDIKSCKLLYSKKLYSQAVYHLQQAVEKCIKGYVLIEGYFKTAEIREITTHLSPLIMMKAVLERTGIKRLAEISNDTTLKDKIENAEATIANEDERIKIAQATQAEIQKLISHIEEYRKKTNLIKQGVTEGLTSIGFSPMPTPFFQAFSAMMTIMILAIITFPHESYTRYPDGKLTPNDYNKQLGIVCETPKIVRLLEGEIRNLEKFYEQND